MNPSNDATSRGSVGGSLQARRNIIKGAALAAIAGAGNLLAESSSRSPIGKNPAPAYSSRVDQWGVQEITLRSDGKYENPFKDVQLQGTFSCGDSNLTVDGFFDGDATWRIRFMPQ